MSLFKTRDIWTTVVGENECFDIGCICLAELDGSPKIIVGSYGGYLRIYSPSFFVEETECGGMKPRDLLCEVNLSDPIIQVAVGRFVSGSEQPAILVLHSQKFATYFITGSQENQDGMSQCYLSMAYEHKLKRTAFNFCYGSFGGIRGRDHVCIQSLDGCLSVYEQEVFAFSHFLPDTMIPGPIAYVPTKDCFVTVSSCRHVECYKLKTLAVSSDVVPRSGDVGKNANAEWIFTIGENAKDININPQSSAAKIIVLGERNLFALSELGQLIFMKKFDFDTSSMCVYTTDQNDPSDPASESEPTRILLTSHSRTLLVYSDTKLLWSAQLCHVPVQTLRVDFGKFKGMIVTLDDEGHLNCSYLGTNPTVFSRKVSQEERGFDYSEAQKELKQLQAVIKEKQSLAGPPHLALKSSKSDFSDQLKVSLSHKLGKNDPRLDTEVEEDGGLPFAILNVVLQSKSDLKDVRASVGAASSFDVSPSTFSIQSIGSGRSSETQVKIFLKHRRLPSSLLVWVAVTCQSNSGTTLVTMKSTKLPLLLIARPCQPEKGASHKLTIDSNCPAVNLRHLYPSCFEEEEEDVEDGSGSVAAFRFYGFQHSVSVMASKSSRYRVQSEHFPSLWPVLEDFKERLERHSSDVRLSFSHKDIPLQEFFQVLDRHFQVKKEISKLEQELEKLAVQLRAVQKRLLVICRDKAQTTFSNLDILLEMVHKQIISVADDIEAKTAARVSAASEASNATNLILGLLQMALVSTRSAGVQQQGDEEELGLLRGVLCPDVELADASHGWEELVECNVMHLLRACRSGNSRDIIVNPTSPAALEGTDKLKRHVRLLFEKLSTGVRLSDALNDTKTEASRSSLEPNDNGAGYSAALLSGSKEKPKLPLLESLREEAGEAYDEGGAGDS